MIFVLVFLHSDLASLNVLSLFVKTFHDNALNIGRADLFVKLCSDLLNLRLKLSVNIFPFLQAFPTASSNLVILEI